MDATAVTDEKVAELREYLTLSKKFKETGQSKEAIQYGEKCLKLAKEVNDKQVQVKASLVIGQVHYSLELYNDAMKYAWMCLDTAKEDKENDDVLEAYYLLGLIHFDLSQYDDAQSYYTVALNIAQDLGNKDAEMRIWLSTGHAHIELEQLNETGQSFQSSFDIAKELGDKHAEMKACLAMKDFHSTLGEYDKAIHYAKMCYGIAKQTSEICKEMEASLAIGEMLLYLGKYNESILYLRKCVEADTEKTDAEGTMVEAYYFLGFAHGKLMQYDDAISFIMLCLDLAKEKDDKVMEKSASILIGVVYYNLKHYDKAVKHARISLEVTTEKDYKYLDREAYNLLAGAHYHLGRFEDFTSCMKMAFEITKTLKFNKGIWKTVEDMLHDPNEEAVLNYKKAIDHAIETGDKEKLMMSYFHLGEIYSKSTQYQDAALSYQKAIDVAIETQDKKTLMVSYFHLGDIYSNSTQYEDAALNYQKAIDVAIETQDKETLMISYFYLGETYFKSTRYDDAILNYKKAIDFACGTGDKEAEMKGYLQLSEIYKLLYQNKECLLHANKALQIAKQRGDKNSEKRANALLFYSHSFLNQRDNAISWAKQLVSNAKETDDMSNELVGITMASFEQIFQSRDASELESQTLDMVHKVKNRLTGLKPSLFTSSSKGLDLVHCFVLTSYKMLREIVKVCDADSAAISYDVLARRLAPNLPIFDVHNPLRIFEEMHNTRPDTDNSRQSETEHQTKTPNWRDTMVFILHTLNLISVMFLNNVDSLAICHSCIGMTHYMLNQPTNARESLKKSVNYFKFVFSRLQDIHKSKVSIVDQYVDTFKLLSKVLIEEGQTDEALLVAEHCRAQALKEALVLNYDMKQELDRPCRVELPDFQSLVSTTKVSILFFSECFKTLHAFLLEDGKEIQFSIRTFLNYSTYDLGKCIQTLFNTEIKVTHSNFTDYGTTPSSLFQGFEIAKSASDEEKQALMKSFRTSKKHLSLGNGSDVAAKEEDFEDESIFTNASEELYHILFGKLSFQSDNEIVIIPDGPLFRVPFAALRNPSTGRYLSEDKKIRLVPSLTTLKLLSECPPDFHMATGALVIGDPQVGKVMQDGVERDIPSLEGAQVEALAIASKFGVDPLIGPQATKRDVIEKLKQGASVVHIAAHGSLSKATILLAPTPEIRQAKTLPDEEDYMLTMADVQQARVRAQLVVLSCCYSGRGEIRAEGVVGMCRAFLASGVRAVVASLWAVDDDATLEFMSYFYLYLGEGQSASTSLQMAMNVVRQNEQYSEPKYWAPFFLMGDDVTIKF